MPYDEDLADRIRGLVGDETGVTEQRMFGGLAFLVGGNMAVAVSGEGGLMVRVERAESDELVATTAARPVEMRGRPMGGWLRIGAENLGAEDDLTTWVGRGMACARALPPKR